MENKDLIRYIKYIYAEAQEVVNKVNKLDWSEQTKSRVGDMLKEKGFEISTYETPPIYGVCYKWFAEKNGITIHVDRQSYGEREWTAGYAVFINHKCYHIKSVQKYIEQITSEYNGEFIAPVRSEATENAIAEIKAAVDEVRKLVNGRGGGELGGSLKYKGWFMDYDGFSCSTFSKGFLHCHAYNDHRWQMEKYSVFLPDGSTSDDFVVDKADRLYAHEWILDDDFEIIFGTDFPGFGHRITDKELLASGKSGYTQFRVRTYGSKTLDTIKWFDNFEDAKKFAFEYAKEQAKNVRPDIRRWARLNPTDVSDELDMLAAYEYYRYENSRFIVFVQGEK